ncbi:MAG: hypothetical protein KC931_27105, partial [Candidatus Omnitrophica bacterium]|nr:hypothetical protein [Candidatus Omnitrophota bacterium]
GVSYSAIDFDLEGNPRPYDATDRPRGDGSDLDIGAVEFIGQAQPNPLPHRPVNLSPEDGETVFGFNPILVSPPMVDDDPSDIHTWTEWQVDDVPNIDPDDLVVGWLSDEEDLLEITVVDEGQYLPADTTFWWRIRHRDNYAGWSEWSVPTSFSTRGSGTLNVPQDFVTIQGALDVSTPGDVILISPGTYNESLVIRVADITLQSLDPMDATTVESTIIDGPRFPTKTIDMKAHGVVLSGLTIRGSTDGIQCNYFDKLIERCVISSGVIYKTSGIIQDNTITAEGGIVNSHGLIQRNVIMYGKGIRSDFALVPLTAT